MTASRTVLTVDIGGTKINAAVVRLSEAGPELSRICTVPTPAREGAEEVVRAAVGVAREALEVAGADAFLASDEELCAVGIASAGVIDSSRGVVSAATDALPGWPGTDIAGAFSAAFSRKAFVLNDVHAHGMGEAAFGVGAGRGSLLLLAIGTGIGGAYVGDGEVMTGAHGAAGHLGHVAVAGGAAEHVVCSCGRKGHLEGFASGPGIAAELTRRGVPAASTREVAELANSEEPGGARRTAAVEVLRDAGFATGRAIGGFLNVFDPEVVAVTGGVASASGVAGDTWWAAVREGVAFDTMDVVARTPLLPARAGNHAALLGAAAFAARAL